MLTARGLDSIEYNCEFLQVTKATRSPAWLVNAICQEPGYLFPDVLSVTQMNPTQLDLVSVKPADPDGGGGNSGSYFLCEGVADRSSAAQNHPFQHNPSLVRRSRCPHNDGCRPQDGCNR